MPPAAPPFTGDLRSKKILLTGASSGIGRALAVELAGRGCRLAIAARREALLEEAAAAAAAEGRERPAVLPADLSRPGAAAELAARAADALGGVDVLVNNAAGTVHGLQWAVGDADEGREVFETNFWSPLALVRELVPGMRQAGGMVVNVTSLVQVSPYPALSHYCASKAALAIATETLRLELRPVGIPVLEVILGPTDTPGSAESRLLPGGAEWLERSRLGSPAAAARQIAKAIEQRRERLVYPPHLRAVYALPGLGRYYARRMSKHVDPDDVRVRRGGSMGAGENRAIRARWEARADPAAAERETVG